MADEDEALPDEAEIGADGAGAEGADTGEADDSEGDLSAVESDASTGEDPGPQHGRAAGEPDETERPVLSRGGNRFQRLSNDNATLREELAAIRRQQEADRQARYAQEQQWTIQQQQERWNVMTPEEKVDYLAQQGEQRLQSMQQQMGMQMQAIRDQTAFEAKASIHPVYARHKDEVERIHNELATQGQFIRREAILRDLLGGKALESATKQTAQARKQGQKKIEAHTTRPTSNKGDASSQRGKAGDSAERRLAGVEI